MNSPAASIRFAGSQYGDQRHVCAFFRNAEEEYRILLPFIKEGFDRGDRAFHVLDPGRRGDHLQRLQSTGIDTDLAESSGQLKVRDWNNAHLDANGRFDQYRMIALIEDELKLGARRGSGISRCIGHMGWALENPPGVDDLMEYEARLNYVLPKYPDPVICVYDLTRFNGAIIVDVLRTHPMVIIGGTLQENPFFVPPDEFLRELREKRSAQIN